MTMRNNGRAWEAHVAKENQALHSEGLATVTKVPTHNYGGIPSKEPKVDFVGSLSPSGRGVFFEAKSGKAVLTKGQRNLLAAHARNGALAFVYHADGYVQLVGGDGKLGEKQTVERWYDVVG